METNIANTIPADYTIGNFTEKTALPLIDILASSMQLHYPAGNDALRSICEQAISYMDEHDLSTSTFYKQISLKIKNFDILKNNTEFPAMKEDNFTHMKQLLAIHSVWIAIKLGMEI